MLKGFLQLLCPHKFQHIQVMKEQTIESIDGGFERVTYHLICQKCGAYITHKHVKTANGVTEWMRL
jgi:hypothetical protein